MPSGPVSDPAGTWRLGVVDTETDDDAHALGLEDPAVTSGEATFEIYPMPGPIVRQWNGPRTGPPRCRRQVAARPGRQHWTE